jgi:hypothetical protein
VPAAFRAEAATAELMAFSRATGMEGRIEKERERASGGRIDGVGRGQVSGSHEIRKDNIHTDREGMYMCPMHCALPA